MYDDTKPVMSKQEDDEDEDDEQRLENQNAETQQIIETGSVTPTKGKYVIHCLTIVGQIVIVDTMCVWLIYYKTEESCHISATFFGFIGVSEDE